MYLVIIESVGNRQGWADNSIKEFDTKEKLEEYLSGMAKTSNKVRVFEATEMRYEVKVNITPVVSSQNREENGSFTKGYYD